MIKFLLLFLLSAIRDFGVYLWSPVNGGKRGVTALLGLARVRKYSNLVHLVYSASTEQDECILDRKYEILGCICGPQSMGGNGSYCTFGPPARKEIE